MIDTAQAVLLLVVVILTFLLLVLGIQVFFILREFRKTVLKANKVLDQTEIIAESVSGPLTSLSTIVSGIKIGTLLGSFLRGRRNVKAKTNRSNINKEEESNE